MNERILIIDREPDILNTLDNILSKAGFYTKSAAKFQEAFDLIKSEPFDLVIMDIRTPEMDGLKAMEKIKKLDDEIEIIVLTGSVSLKNAVQALRSDGAFDFLFKPLENMDQLIVSVKQALEKGRLKRESNASVEKLRQVKEELEYRVKELHKLAKANAKEGSNELWR
jgi:DNA-binding NtrC family response regulator